MPITLNCPKCRKPFRVRDESAGMRVKCPSCGAILQVPAALSATSFDNPTDPPAAVGGTAPPVQAPPMAGSVRGPGAESLLDNLPMSPSAGPPSLAGPSVNQREDEMEADRGRRPAPPPPNTRRPAPVSSKPAASSARRTVPDEQIVEDAAGWSSVRGGLRWIQIGLFFSTLYALAVLGVTLYCFQQYTEVPAKVSGAPKGLLEVKGINLFTEIQIVALVASGVLLFLFGFVGLLKCLSIPDAASTRGLVSGTILFSLLSAAGFVVHVWPEVNRLFVLPELPKDVVRIANQSFYYLVALTGTWLVLLLGQAGAALRSGKVLTDAAYSALMVVILIVGVKVGDHYYPLTVKPADGLRKMTNDERLEMEAKEVQTNMIQTGYQTALAVIIAFRLMSLAGTVRSAIRRWREENQAALGTAAE